jgi:broad specificity phosphatase PhoE
VASHSLFIRVLACEVLDVGPATYRHFKLSNAHAVLVKFHPAPPHQLAGLNIPPA